MLLVDFEQTDFWLDLEKKHTCLHLLAQNMIGVSYGFDFFNDANITVTRLPNTLNVFKKRTKTFVKAFKKNFSDEI